MSATTTSSSNGQRTHIRFGTEPWQETRIEIIEAMVQAWWQRNRRNFGTEHAKAMQALAGDDSTGDDSNGDST
jgi:hypothetical protein